MLKKYILYEEFKGEKWFNFKFCKKKGERGVGRYIGVNRIVISFYLKEKIFY